MIVEMSSPVSKQKRTFTTVEREVLLRVFCKRGIVAGVRKPSISTADIEKACKQSPELEEIYQRLSETKSGEDIARSIRSSIFAAFESAEREAKKKRKVGKSKSPAV